MSNIIFGKSFLALPSLAALVVLGNGLSVNAQTVAPETIVIPVATKEIANRTITPIPGTAETSSAILNSGSTKVSEKTEPSNLIVQSNTEVNRPTRSAVSYIGVAGNVGLSGGSSVLDCTIRLDGSDRKSVV